MYKLDIFEFLSKLQLIPRIAINHIDMMLRGMTHNINIDDMIPNLSLLGFQTFKIIKKPVSDIVLPVRCYVLYKTSGRGKRSLN